MTTLSELRPGDAARVVLYDSVSGLHVRLRELGMVRGTPLRVIRLSPLGDPMEIQVRGSRLSVRKKDAAHIQVIREEA